MNETLLSQMWEQINKFDEDITRMVSFSSVAELCAVNESDNALSGSMWLLRDNMEQMVHTLEAQQQAMLDVYRQMKAVAQQVKSAPTPAKKTPAKKKAKAK